jgi:3' terminal RNA ribose 2'-O-methyltransferase Hen1
MLLTITTTHQPATDMGYLLHKSPFRSQSADLTFGTVNIFYPEATREQCTVAIMLDIDPVELVRGSRHMHSTMPLEQYVNDRPYVCSSFMSVALSRVFGQTLNGRCKTRPELVDVKMPLTCRITVLPCRGGELFLRKLFEPLGYTVQATRHPLDDRFPEWGESLYYTVALFKEATLVELFNHLYVLIPVLDNQKHYYVDKSEIEKLLKRGEGWLAQHPEKEQIAKRYFKNRISYTREALDRLIEVNPAEEDQPTDEPSAEESVESRIRLNEERLGTVLSVLKSVQAESVMDLGCGEGRLLQLLLQERQFKKIVGLDVSIRALEIATDRLKLADMPGKQRERIQIWHGSLIYRDRRLEGFDAAAVIEVIEHLDAARLKAFERVLFECAKPKHIVLTTPNRDYNIVWENVGKTGFRHGDHRFEWTRAEFETWARRIADQYAYQIRFLNIGAEVEQVGTPTQMAVFNKG